MWNFLLNLIPVSSWNFSTIPPICSCLLLDACMSRACLWKQRLLLHFVSLLINPPSLFRAKLKIVLVSCQSGCKSLRSLAEPWTSGRRYSRIQNFSRGAKAFSFNCELLSHSRFLLRKESLIFCVPFQIPQWELYQDWFWVFSWEWGKYRHYGAWLKFERISNVLNWRCVCLMKDLTH